jgi:hypothetical protein
MNKLCNNMSHLPSRMSNETAKREPRRCVGLLWRRRDWAEPGLAATGATNLAALKDEAAISAATICDEEAACDISSPLWLAPLPLCPALIDTPSYVH